MEIVWGNGSAVYNVIQSGWAVDKESASSAYGVKKLLCRPLKPCETQASGWRLWIRAYVYRSLSGPLRQELKIAISDEKRGHITSKWLHLIWPYLSSYPRVRHNPLLARSSEPETKRAHSLAYLPSSKNRAKAAKKWQWFDLKTRWYRICRFYLQYAVKTNLLCHKTALNTEYLQRWACVVIGWLFLQ